MRISDWSSACALPISVSPGVIGKTGVMQERGQVGAPPILRHPRFIGHHKAGQAPPCMLSSTTSCPPGPVLFRAGGYRDEKDGHAIASSEDGSVDCRREGAVRRVVRRAGRGGRDGGVEDGGAESEDVYRRPGGRSRRGGGRGGGGGEGRAGGRE